MKSILLFFVVSILTVRPLFAQHYDIAAGIRMGSEFGLSAQTRILEHTTIESMVHTSLYRNYQAATVIIEQHQNLLTDRLNFYGGVGPYQCFARDTMTALPGGISLILGTEISIGRLNVSWDYKPTVNLWGKDDRKFSGETALTIRYIFKKEPKRKVKWSLWKPKSNKKKGA